MDQDSSLFDCPQSGCNFSCHSRKKFVRHSRKTHQDAHFFMCENCCQHPKFVSTSLKEALEHIVSAHPSSTLIPLFSIYASSVKKWRSKWDKELEPWKKKFKIYCKHLHCSFETKKPSLFKLHKVKSHGNSMGDPVIGDGNGKESSDADNREESSGANMMDFDDGANSSNANVMISENLSHSVTSSDISYTQLTYSDNEGKKRGRSRPVECPICHKLRTTMARHLKVHSDDKPYSCNSCDYKSRWKKDLDMHILIHSQILNFVCEHCSKRFVTSSDLQKHNKTHTGEKKFECELCDKRFRLSHHLKDHIRRKHRKN